MFLKKYVFKLSCKVDITRRVPFRRYYCKLKVRENVKTPSQVTIEGVSYETDDWTNVTSKILALVGRNLHLQKKHPLNLVHERIIDYFYKTFKNSRGNPLFSVYNNIKPTVSVSQNFDSLLIPVDHPSRMKSDCYYVNKGHLLRAHTTAHQAELIRSGLNDFLVVGDVYRRDEIDSTHYPVFHQVDGVRLRTREQLFPGSEEQLFCCDVSQGHGRALEQDRQACHSGEAVVRMERELKSTLEGLARGMFGDSVDTRWVRTQFPFTEPSWELEVCLEDGRWLEVLGCGIMRQEILHAAGVQDRIGWAFGLGLERLAMRLYHIPDIRLFWSTDSGFLGQFNGVQSHSQPVTYQPISQYPQCSNDLSFWLPEAGAFSSNDLYDLVRSVGGDVIEQVRLLDEWRNPRTGRVSHCYRVTYRHMERTLTQLEVNRIHERIASMAQQLLHVSIR